MGAERRNGARALVVDSAAEATCLVAGGRTYEARAWDLQGVLPCGVGLLCSMGWDWDSRRLVVMTWIAANERSAGDGGIPLLSQTGRPHPAAPDRERSAATRLQDRC